MPPAISDQNQFLSDLSANELAVLRPHLVDFDITAGDCLHHIGDPIERVVFPHSGVICMTLPLRDTAGAVVALVGREGVVGGLLATASMPSSCNAEVRIGGRASLISAAAFRHALDHHPGISRLAARYDAAMMAQVQQNAVCNAAHKVEGRISRCLLELHDRSGDDKIPLKQDTLAQMLAIRRTTVTLTAGNLEKDGPAHLRPRRHSMRHQHRHGHCAQHAAGDTAKHELAQTRVAVAAHYDEIGTLISRMGE